MIATTYLIIHHGLDSGAARASGHAKKSSSHTHSHPRTTHGGSAAPKSTGSFYTVRPGDSLSSISARTGVPVSTIQELNRNLNPQALQVGQRLRLRR
jgi:spore germination protein